MTQANQKIRRTAAASGVRLWQIADALGFTECMLRKELPADKQAEILRIIAELEEEG